MTMTFRVICMTAAIALIAGGLLWAEPKPGAGCKILTLDEATAILGPGTKSEMAAPDGKARMCVFLAGKKRLSVSAVDEGSNAAMRREQLDQLRKENKGKVERGLGDFAVSFTEGDVSAIIAIKGGRVVDVRTTGAGSSSELFRAMRTAAAFVLGR